MPPPPATAASLQAGPPEGNAAVLRLSGRLDAYSVGSLWNEALAALAARGAVPVVIDAAGWSIATARASRCWSICCASRVRGRGGDVCAICTARSTVCSGSSIRSASRRSRRRPRSASRWPSGSARWARSFCAKATSALLSSASRPPRSPQRLLTRTAYAGATRLLIAQRVGADAVPIVMLIGFLIGVILAFQTAVRLARLRRRHLCRQRRGAGCAARAGAADDRDHPGGPLRLGVRRRDRHDEGQRGDRCAHHHGPVARALPGGAAPARRISVVPAADGDRRSARACSAARW